VYEYIETGGGNVARIAGESDNVNHHAVEPFVIASDVFAGRLFSGIQALPRRIDGVVVGSCVPDGIVVEDILADHADRRKSRGGGEDGCVSLQCRGRFVGAIHQRAHFVTGRNIIGVDFTPDGDRPVRSGGRDASIGFSSPGFSSSGSVRT
jgi:hypothetical protein